MSSRASKVDLDALALPETPPASPPSGKRRWLWRLLPVVVLIGFLAVLIEALLPMFEDAIVVTVVRPVEVAGAEATEGTVVVQAAGWVEPDPFPIRVPALTDGIVASVAIQEADAVEVGDVVAELIDDEAKIALSLRKARLEEANAELRAAEIERDIANQSFEAAIEVKEATATAKAEYKRRVAERERRKAALASKRASLTVAERELDVQRFLESQGAAGPWQVELALASLEARRSEVAVLEAELARVDADVETAAARRDAALTNEELRLEEKRRVRLAEAEIARCRAAVNKAQAERDEASLRLDRMKVVSTVRGVVLHRHAEPGSVVGPGGDRDPIAHLYDPSSLRVRVDVPQAQLAKVSFAQEAEIRCDVLRGRVFKGTVIRIVETADIQKVTVEVQVRIDEPDGLLKPEMLCQVSMLAPHSEGSSSKGTALRLPASCVQGDSVWVLDPQTHRAVKRTVELASRNGDQVVVRRGLNLSDKVIATWAEPLREGASVRVGGTQP